MTDRSDKGWWRGSTGVDRIFCAGSTIIDRPKETWDVWGADKAFLSPPESNGYLTGSLESDESSEECEDFISGLVEEIMLQEEEDEEVINKETSAKANPTLRNPDSTAWTASKLGTSPTSPQSTLTGAWCFNWGNLRNKQTADFFPPLKEGNAVDEVRKSFLDGKIEERTIKSSLFMQMQNLQLDESSQKSSISPPRIRKDFSPSRSKQGPPLRKKGNPSYSQVPRENFLALAIDKALSEKRRRQAKSMGEGAASNEVCEQAGNGLEGLGILPKGRRKERACSQGSVSGVDCSKKKVEHKRISILGSGDLAGRAVLGGTGGGGAADGKGILLRPSFVGALASRECGGTGFFMPRQVGSMDVQDSRHVSSKSSSMRRHFRLETCKLKPEDSGLSHSSLSSITTLQEVAPNISLPSEWTY
ncbi:hypothetical protein KP509_37G017100 [Ceratopteris richardii]|uniref:Uncharacterized protein n=1 Tax=Ceratopteris richardii TaxID=49495 RepID=A0A8T2Q6U5_CERRI|nr:hypothetical protein KP509_37G017100 [Ceratopteris richardii]